MKKIVFLVSIILLLTTIESRSQNFVFHRVSAPVVYGDTATQVVVKAILTNNASTTQSFILARAYKNFPTGWSQSVCNYQNCFGESEIIPPDGSATYTLGAHQSDTVLSFDFYGTTIGTGTAVWKAYVHGNPSVYIQDTFTVRMGPVGITPISSIVKGYDLQQNYPNPFNPSTSINFSIPKSADVNLVVYDMMGKEVARLLNNTKLAQGTYKYDFNSGDFKLSSGMYFYKLSTSDFAVTKKMILIK
jgi:hypothetical protein